IRSAQWWQLRKDGPGVAEMSALIGDMADAPEGDVVMDPSIIFTGEGFYGGGDIYDSYLDQAVPEGMYGSNSYLYLKGNVNQEQRIIMGICHSATKIAGANIQSATLSLYTNYISGTPSNATACAYKNTRNWYCSSVRWSNDGFNGPGSAWTGGEYTTNYQGNHVRMPTSTGWMEFNLSQAFKSHYATYTYDTGDKGFLIKLVNTPSAYWRICASEYGTVGLRPFLTVKCAATDYGVHITPNADNPIVQGWMERLNMSANGDKFQIVRYLDEKWHVPIGWLPTFCNNANSKGLKVFIHSPVAANVCYSNPPMTSASSYAWHIYELLYNARTQIDRGDVIAIEIGGEESDWIYPDKTFTDIWFPVGFNPPNDMWFGNAGSGANFAAYYLAARDIIKNSTFASWKNIQIWSGGSPEKHESIDYNLDTTAAWGNASNFIGGFIDAVISVNREKLPDAIAIHGYTGTKPPEYTVNESGVQEWPNRIKKLYDLCTAKGYIPNFVVTEYGFSPTNNGFGPITGASEISQAVYYLRSCLINSTVQPYNGIGWHISSYFFHHMTDSANNHGFHNIDNVDPIEYPPYYFGSGRAIKGISRGLFNPSASVPLKLRDPYTKVWVPLVTAWNDTNKGTAYCGWETNTGTKWGAIWRYDREDAYKDFIPPHPSLTFLAPQSAGVSKVTNRYQFSISAGSASLSLISSTDIAGGTPSNGKIPFDIPGVDENPIILEFSNEQ
ncbi:MAG TPA: DNRLRE domain-containing protein, partial [bacterium]|nr:DNRLRE domain-containing protein [bacterium]